MNATLVEWIKIYDCPPSSLPTHTNKHAHTLFLNSIMSSEASGMNLCATQQKYHDLLGAYALEVSISGPLASGHVIVLLTMPAGYSPSAQQV